MHMSRLSLLLSTESVLHVHYFLQQSRIDVLTIIMKYFCSRVHKNIVYSKIENMLTMPFIKTIRTHKWLMPLPLQPWSRFGLICSKWSALEMLHSLHLVQQYRPPTESNIKKIFKYYIHVFINVTTKHEFVIYWLVNPLYLVCCLLIIHSNSIFIFYFWLFLGFQ